MAGGGHFDPRRPGRRRASPATPDQQFAIFNDEPQVVEHRAVAGGPDAPAIPLRDDDVVCPRQHDLVECLGGGPCGWYRHPLVKPRGTGLRESGHCGEQQERGQTARIRGKKAGHR